MREDRAQIRRLAASFSANDANFCISESFSTTVGGGGGGDGSLSGGTAVLSDVVRRGGFGGLKFLVDDAVVLSAAVASDVSVTACWSSAAVEYCRQPNGLNVDRPRHRTRCAVSVTSERRPAGARMTSPFSVLSDEQFFSVAESSVLVSRLQRNNVGLLVRIIIL